MDLVIVGHLSRDLLITPDTTREALGGCAYAMLASSLGVANAGIVSKVGEDFEQEYWNTLRSSGLSLTGLHKSGPKSTRYVNKYDKNGNRIQFVENLAEKITLDDFPEDYYDARAVHFSPLSPDEIDIECIRLSRSNATITSLDAQGYIRSIETDGKVAVKNWVDRDEVLSLLDIVKLHEEELRIAMRGESELAMVSQILSLGPRIVIITRDKRGSTIYTRNEQVNIPLVQAEIEIDSTGCGDVYTIGFLIEYMRSSNLKRAGIFASTCASFNVETSGPYNMPSRLDVETRMQTYLE